MSSAAEKRAILERQLKELEEQEAMEKLEAERKEREYIVNTKFNKYTQSHFGLYYIKEQEQQEIHARNAHIYTPLSRKTSEKQRSHDIIYTKSPYPMQPPS